MSNIYSFIKKRNLYIVFFMTIIINVINILNCIIDTNFNSFNNLEGYNLECPLSVFNIFLLCNSSNNLSLIYLSIIPAIFSLVYWNIAEKNDIMKCNFVKKCGQVFLTGFVVCFCSLLISLILTSAFFPSVLPEVSTGYFPLGYRGNSFYELYIKFPYIYILIYILFFSVYAGICSLFSLSLSYVFDFKVTVLIFSFLFNIASVYIVNYFGVSEFDIRNLLLPTSFSYNVNLINLFVYFVAMSLVSCLIVYIEVICREKKVEKA